MIRLEDIEKRLSVKQADSMTNPDGTEAKENQQNVPDAKSNKTRSPWIDAGIGAAGGGLLGSALGYLYGHKGKWLAYDAIAGGIAGGGVGYMIGNSNKGLPENSKKISQAKEKEVSKSLETINKERSATDSYWSTFSKLKDNKDLNRTQKIRVAFVAKDLEEKGYYPDEAFSEAVNKVTNKDFGNVLNNEQYILGRVKPELYNDRALYNQGLKYVPEKQRPENDKRPIVPLTAEELSKGLKAFLAGRKK